MKRYSILLFPIITSSLFLQTGCSNQLDGIRQESSSRYIEFGQQTLAVQSRVVGNNGLKDEFIDNDNFGVIGYCVPLDVYGQPDYAAGNSEWTIKKNNAVPDVFNKQKVTLINNTWVYDFNNPNSTSYNPKYWYDDGIDTNGNPKDDITNADNYRYNFYAYSPYRDDVFQWTRPVNETDKGAPFVKVRIPQVASENMNPADTPDAMLSVISNFQRQINTKLSFNFRHVFTALGFEVNNFSDKDLEIHSIKLKGTFWRSVNVDYNNGVYNYNESDTYTGTYVIFDQQTNNEESLSLPAPGVDATATTAECPVGGNYLLLLSGGFKGDNYFGPIFADGSQDIKLIVDYTFGGVKKDPVEISRPATFLPKSGVKYTSQLNFVGNAFVVQFVVDNSEGWENGESDDNGDIVFD